MLPRFFAILTLSVRLTSSETCQCIEASTQSCLGYDSKLQADTLDEAIAFFPDLSFDRDEENEQSDVECKTQYCQDCRRDMRRRLEKVGLLNNTSIITGTTTNSTCQKYRFSLEEKESSDDDSNEESSSESHETSSEKSRKGKTDGHRSKRELSPDTNLIGTRFTISCAVKGVSVDPTGTVSLCSSCWVWRRLPNNYRPQYVNELVCDNSDSSCLSGYAQCNVGHRTFEAVRNDSGVSTVVTLSAGSYCECRIAKSSTLQSLVSGTGISGTFNPLANNSSAIVNKLSV